MDVRLSALIAADTARLVTTHRLDWSPLQGARLLLTGCTGPFGWWLLHRLSHAAAHEGLALEGLTLLTRRPSAAEDWAQRLHGRLRIVVIEGDITRLGEIGNARPALRATHVIHGATTAAAETHAGASPIEKFDTVVNGTRALIDTLDDRPPRRLVYLSSGIAYGHQGSSRLSESDPGAPPTTDVAAALGHAKRTAEFLMSCAARRWGAELAIARCFSFSGPGLPLDLHYAVGNFIAQAVRGGPIVLQGDGRAIRAYQHLGDTAIWLLAMLTQPLPEPEPLVCNVGSDHAVSMRELAQTIADLVSPGCGVEVRGTEQHNASGNRVSVYVPDLTRARAVLGLQWWTPLEESIRQMAHWAGQGHQPARPLGH